MTDGLTQRMNDFLLRQLKRDKEEHLQKLSAEEKKKLATLAAEKRRELAEAEAKEAELEKKLAAEKDALKKIDQAIEEVQPGVALEQELFHLQRRMEEFRGSSDPDVRRRLISEGFNEAIVADAMRRRTSDAKFARDGGLTARLTAETGLDSLVDANGTVQVNPLDRIMRGAPTLYDMTDRRVLDRLECIRRDAADRGYLREAEASFVNTVAERAHAFSQNDFYRERDERGYLSRTTQAVSELREQLGLDFDQGLRYGGKKL